jgi:hypothetical protein
MTTFESQRQCHKNPKKSEAHKKHEPAFIFETEVFPSDDFLGSRFHSILY